MNRCPGCGQPVSYAAYWYRHETAVFKCPNCQSDLHIVPGRRRKLWYLGGIPFVLLWSLYEANRTIPIWVSEGLLLALWVFLDSRFNQFRLYTKPEPTGAQASGRP